MQKNLGKMQKDLEKDQKKVQKVYDKYIEKHYGTPTGAREKANFNRTVTAHIRKFYDPIDKLQRQNQKEREDKTSLYGKGGKVVAKREVETKTVRGKWKPVKEEAEQIDELSKATKDAYVAKRGSQLSSMLSGHTRGKQLTGKQQANAVKGIKTAMGGNKDKSKLPKLLPRMATFGEELVGGQKKLDVNKNKRLDAQDFALLRAKKKTVKEEANKAKKPAPKADPHAGARTEIGKQKSIKRMLDKHGMRW
jgi:hypothetical protein